MWEDDVAQLLAAAASEHADLRDYETPGERLAADLDEQGRTPEDRARERRLRLITLGGDGDIEVA